MKKNSSSSDMLEHSAGDISSPLLSPKRSKTSTNETFQFMLRVVNSSFIFSTLSLPFYFQMIGIIMGALGYAFFGALSCGESVLLLDLKYYARSKKFSGSLTQLFELFKMPKYISDIYRSIMILNAFIYVVLLLSIFQSSIQSLIYMMTKSQELSKWAQSLSSQQFIQFIGSLLMIPFFIKWKYPVYLVAFARFLGVFSIMFIIISAYAHSPSHTKQTLLPSSSTVVQSLITTPTILLAFAYHPQFFTGKLLEKRFDNDDIEKKLKLGALYGSVLMMSVELTLSILAAITFFPVNSGLQSYYGNLIRMLFQFHSLEDSNLADAYYYIFYVCIAVSAQLQVLQYIPYATVLILNILDKKPKMTKHTSQEFMLITDGEFQKEEKEVKKTSQTLKTKFRQSLVLHEGEKMRENKKYSLFITILVYLMAFLLAMAKPPILLLACLMGATTQNFVTFLIPSLLYLDKQFKGESNIYKKCFAWFTLIFSICFACVSVSFGLYGLYTDEI